MTVTLDAELWAAAVDGDRAALERCLEVDVDGKIARSQRLASALALEATAADLDGPALAPWRARLRQVAAHSMVLEQALESTGRVLGEAEVSWAPLKGLDLASRIYPRAEQRPTSDVDLLVASGDLDRAQAALLAAGWKPLSPGRRVERYLREEGYAWQARAPGGVLVELHYRLWGSVAPEAGDAMMDAAGLEVEPSQDSLGPAARRLRLADAYVLAAHHLWLDEPPRRLGAVRDLTMISRAMSSSAPATENFASEVERSATRLDLHLPVTLGARWSAELWRESVCREIVERLTARLAWSESRWLRAQSTPSTASYTRMTLARHLAGRRTRHGLARLAWRRLWAHPGIVEAAYGDESHPFWRRRLEYQLRSWGLR